MTPLTYSHCILGEITLDLAHYSGFGFLVACVTLYLGLFFVSGLAGSRSETDLDLLSVVIFFLD